MRRYLLALDLLDIEHEDTQLTLRRDPAVLLTQRAGGGVSRILCGLFAAFLLKFEQTLKACVGHIDLAPDLKEGYGLRKAIRKRLYSLDILRDILADPAVAPR